MKKSKGLWLVIGAVIASLAFVGYLFFGGTDSPIKMINDGKTTLVEFNGSNIHEEKNGKLLWSLKADKILLNPKTKEVFLTQLKGEFHKGETILHVDAKEGHYSPKDHLVTMTGEVFGKTDDGITFKGQDLLYDTESRTMKSRKAFTYKDGNTTIWGDTLTGNMVLKEIKAKGHVKLIKEN